MGRTLPSMNHSKILSDPPPRVMEIRTRINKWNLIKIKNFCSAKETRWKDISLRMGENDCKWSNWPRIHLQNIQTAHEAQFQKNEQSNQKAGQRTKQTFVQRRHTDGWQTGEKMLNIIRAKQIKTTMRYHLMLVRKTAIKKSTNKKCWRGCGEEQTLLHCWWEWKRAQALWSTVCRFLKKLEIELP